jgi:hypothetical protein
MNTLITLRINIDRMKVFEITQAQEASNNGPEQGWKSYCKNTPRNKMSSSWESGCVSRGHLTRKTGKSQLIGNKRVDLDGKRLASTKHGGPVSPTKAG